MQKVLTLAAAIALTGMFTPSSADAGLFDCFKKKNNACCPDPCCEPAPSCCAPVATCCAPEPTCCAPAPTCCQPEPCCTPDPCCAPARSKCKLPRLGLFKKMFKRKSKSCCSDSCAPDPCCESAPSCCAPVAPSCCAPAAPSCCAPVLPAPACGCGS